MDILDFLRSDGSIIVNKKLAHEIGLQEAVVYSELVSLYKYWSNRGELTEDGFFFCTMNHLEEHTAIGQKSLQRITNRLKKLNLICKDRRGLPAKTYYKITNDIYNLFTDVPDKSGQFVQTDKDSVYNIKNDENPRHNQNGQIVHSRKDNLFKADKTNCPTNNTRINNTKINNQEEEIKNACNKNVFYETLYDFLEQKEIDHETIHKTIHLLIENNIEMVSYSDVKNQFTYMMEKLTNEEIDNHNNFAKYFVNGLLMRTTQTKASKKYQEEQRIEYEKALKKKEERTSLYYNWLDD